MIPAPTANISRGKKGEQGVRGEEQQEEVGRGELQEGGEGEEEGSREVESKGVEVDEEVEGVVAMLNTRMISRLGRFPANQASQRGLFLDNVVS